MFVKPDKSSENIDDNQKGIYTTKKLTIPAKLYGRDLEINTLKKVFSKVLDTGISQFTVVTGYSGIGKSYLIHKMQDEILKGQGHYIFGKFDQLSKNTPYIPIIQALKDIVFQFLEKDEGTLVTLKKTILNELGDIGNVIVEMIPELKLIIGEQPTLNYISSQHAGNRFELALMSFIKSITSKEHPLVLFIDDLQWADIHTLNLLKKIITNQEIQYLHLIGAYRENEIDELHILTHYLYDIRRIGYIVEEIYLNPLTLEDVKSLLLDIFCDHNNDIGRLAMICIEKTQGNPFYLHQFLQVLYSENIIHLNLNINQWEWNLTDIEKMDVTSNVVNFVIQNIKKLDKDSQQYIKIASCLGTRFELDKIIYVSKANREGIIYGLWQALQQGLIIRDKQHNRVKNNEDTNIFYTFLHDRVQQAAYSLVDANEKKEYHYKIGLFYYEKDKRNIETEKIFEIANNLNIAYELSIEKFNTKRYAEINLKAGIRAKDSTSYTIALDYFKNTLQILGKDPWENHYKMNLKLYSELAEVSYLMGNFKLVDQYIKKVFSKSDDLFETIQVNIVKIRSLISQGKRMEGIDLSMNILRKLGMNIPQNPGYIFFVLRIIKIKLLNFRKDKEQIYQIFMSKSAKEITYNKAISEVYSYVFAASYNLRQDLLIVIILNVILMGFRKKGSDYSFLGYAGLALFMIHLGFIKEGLKWRDYSRYFMEKIYNSDSQPKHAFIDGCFLFFYDSHINNIKQLSIKGYAKALENGDVEFAAYNLFQSIHYDIVSGKPLEQINEEVQVIHTKIMELKQITQLHFVKVIQQPIHNLLGKVKDPKVLSGDIFKEEEMFEYLEENNEKSIRGILFYQKMFISFLFEDYKTAKRYLDLNLKNKLNISSSLWLQLTYFYEVLIYSANYKNLTLLEKIYCRVRIIQNLHKFKKYSKYSKDNFINKYHILKAELYVLKGNIKKAIKEYDLAILYSKKYGFINEEALCYENLYTFYNKQSNVVLARKFLKKALICYKKWNAYAKVNQLKYKLDLLETLNHK